MPSRVTIMARQSPIKHVVFIMQENRSFDSYFGTFPGADGIPMVDGVPTVSVYDPATGQDIKPYHNTSDFDIDAPHNYGNALNDINGGTMDGFIAEEERRHPDAPNPDAVMAYHTAAEIPNYWTYAQDFVLQDHMFEPTLAWSRPAHLYLVSGWSAKSSTPFDPMSFVNDPVVPGRPPTPTKPIYGWTDITYLLHAQGVSWAYYYSNPPPADPDDYADSSLDIWNPLPNFVDVHQDKQLNHVKSSDNFLAQAAAGTLPAVSWVVPSEVNSEHSPQRVSMGMGWVTSLVNAVMQGPDWKSTAIFVSWDDWGGLYDHVVPPTVDQNGYGIRVPGLLISPYARAGSIDHQTLSFDAYLKFIEDVFLNGQRLDPATDGRPDSRPIVRENVPILGNLMSEFDFNQTPLPPVILPDYPLYDAPLTGQGTAFAMSTGVSSKVKVAAFTDADPQALVYDFKASIDWGDGTVTPVKISLGTSTGAFNVWGTHAYAAPGTYPVVVQVNDRGGASTVVSSQAVVSG